MKITIIETRYDGNFTWMKVIFDHEGIAVTRELQFQGLTPENYDASVQKALQDNASEIVNSIAAVQSKQDLPVSYEYNPDDGAINKV